MRAVNLAPLEPGLHAGSKHSIEALYRLYASNHPDGTLHKNKAEADAYEKEHHHEATILDLVSATLMIKRMSLWVGRAGEALGERGTVCRGHSNWMPVADRIHYADQHQTLSHS